MSLSLLEQLGPAATDEDRGRLALRISLASLSPSLRTALYAAAVPHWFDAEFLGSLLQAPRAKATMLVHRLAELSYIEDFPGGSYDVHESSRKLLLADLWRDKLNDFKDLAGHATHYCENQDLGDARWRIEWVYHLLLVDPLRAARELDAACRTWYRAPNFAYDKVEAMLKGAREHEDASRLPRAAVNVLLLWEARLDLNYWNLDHSRLSAASEKLSLIEVDAAVDPQLAADTSYVSGRLHQLSKETLEARTYLSEALSLYERVGDVTGIADANLALGEIERMLGDIGVARQYFHRSQVNYRAIGDEAGQARSNEFSSQPEQLFLQSLDFIEYLVARIARQLHLKQQEGEELASIVKIRMIEDDYGVFRRFAGRSSLRTYLTAVIKTIAADVMVKLLGKWRPSKQASRSGEAAKLLEMLLVRDGYSLDQASTILKTTYGMDLSGEEIDRLAIHLPRRVVRRFIGEEYLLGVPARDEGGEQRAIAREIGASRQRALAALRRALSALPEEDRRLVMMKTTLSVADISRVLGIEQKPLYRRLEKIYKNLQQDLLSAGVRREDIKDVFGADLPKIAEEY